MRDAQRGLGTARRRSISSWVRGYKNYDIPRGDMFWFLVHPGFPAGDQPAAIQIRRRGQARAFPAPHFDEQARGFPIQPIDLARA